MAKGSAMIPAPAPTSTAASERVELELEDGVPARVHGRRRDDGQEYGEAHARVVRAGGAAPGFGRRGGWCHVAVV